MAHPQELLHPSDCSDMGRELSVVCDAPPPVDPSLLDVLCGPGCSKHSHLAFPIRRGADEQSAAMHVLQMVIETMILPKTGVDQLLLQAEVHKQGLRGALAKCLTPEQAEEFRRHLAFVFDHVPTVGETVRAGGVGGQIAPY